MHRVTLSDITIRTEFKPGDIGYLTFLHGTLYHKEYNYGVAFEAYVAAGLSEFFMSHNPARSRVWVCEHAHQMVGFLMLMDRGDAAQLRYFIIVPEYRGIGLGTKLMNSFMEFLHHCGYKAAFLWTTRELTTATNLYLKYGFTLTEETESAAFGKIITEQRYDLTLA